MAEQLVDDMSAAWNPEDYKDEFKDAVMKLVDQRVKAGKTASVTPLEHVDESVQGSAQIINLTELLKRSLRKPAGENKNQAAESTPAAKEKPATAKKGRTGTTSRTKTAAPKKRTA